ncbi:MAG: hypothetical protein ABWK15_01755 [Dissulfuribacterales bacterium]
MSHLLQQIQAAVKYVESRQNADGGFCFYRYEDWGISESNIPDTFYGRGCVVACRPYYP